MDQTTLINDVSDTSLWVAYYRARESKRKDALFKDPFAEMLVGERGKQIAENMKSGTLHSEWTVIIRTVVIDAYIQRMVKEGIDTVLNLGAGMDTRPYRMDLPANLKWMEVDYPHIIAHKNKLLQNETTNCKLSRVELDLSDEQKRIAFFEKTASESKNILVITEGVVLYLKEEQTSDLARDLFRFPEFTHWIVEYMNPQVYPYLKDPQRAAKLKNAPFQFFPADWLRFFEQRGWVPYDLKYLGEVGAQLKRPMPLPRSAFLYRWFAPKSTFEKARRMTGFLLLKRKK
jgi:methyltransferase (TIGR00027 family)